MTSALATLKNEEKSLAVTRDASTETRPEDLVVPRLLIMQNTSEQVGDGKAQLGDILNSTTSAIIGGVEKPVEIIPLKMFKTWRVMDISGKPAQFVREEPVTSENEKREWEGFEEVLDRKTKQKKPKCPVRYDFSYNFFVLLKKEVDEDDAFPCVISFRRTSAKAGKQLATHLFKRNALKQHPSSKTVLIKIVKQKKETNTYGVFEIHPGEATNEKGMAAAEYWLPHLDSMRAKVDEERLSDEPAAVAPVVMGEADGSQGAY